MSIVSGSIISVSPNLFADINKYNAQAIWINEGVENNFQLFLSNSSDSIKAGQLSYQLRDIDSGQVEIDNPVGYISSSPKDKFVFPFSISDLPYLGAKKLIAKSSSEDLLSDPSGAIIVSTQSEVHFDDKS